MTKTQEPSDILSRMKPCTACTKNFFPQDLEEGICIACRSLPRMFHGLPKDEAEALRKERLAKLSKEKQQLREQKKESIKKTAEKLEQTVVEASDAIVKGRIERAEAILSKAEQRKAELEAEIEAATDAVGRKMAKQKLENLNSRIRWAEKQTQPATSEGDAAIPGKRSKQDLVDQELARRILSKRRLLPFVQRFNPEYLPGWVHAVICKKLEQFSQDVIDGKSPRLILQLPPRSGKSQLASIELPAWHLGRRPDHEIISASHTTNLALKFSRKVRQRITIPSYKSVFTGTHLSKDNTAAEYWTTTEGGGVKAVGVGTAVVGSGAHILVIDDPFKGKEEAESAQHREKVKEWYQTEAYTRLAPGGGVLVIMQRWHEDDLVGWLLSEQEEGGEFADKWELLSFPAIAEEDEQFRKKGEALHPERFPLRDLLRIREVMTPANWNALYQQNPIPEDGDFFTSDMLYYYEPGQHPPLDELTIYNTWDLAIGLRESNDSSVGISAGIDQNDNLWLFEVVKGRMSSLQIVDAVLELQQRSRAVLVGIEKGHIQMAIGPLLNKEIQARRQYEFALQELSTGRRDKMSRAQTIRGRMQQGKVFLPKKAPWLGDFLAELLKFPNGRHDDQVDALAHLGLMMEQMYHTLPPPAPRKKSWRDNLGLIGSNHARTDMSA